MGLRSLFFKEFQPEGYGRCQESKLRNRQQQTNESATEYYYDVMDLCRSIDPNMSEVVKLDHLFRGLKKSLLEKTWVKKPQTCASFLAEIKIHTEAEKLAGKELSLAVLRKDDRKVSITTPKSERKEELKLAKKKKDEEFQAHMLKMVQNMQIEIMELEKKQEKRSRSTSKKGRTEDAKPD